MEGQCGLGMRLVWSECGGAMWTGNETSLEWVWRGSGDMVTQNYQCVQNHETWFTSRTP